MIIYDMEVHLMHGILRDPMQTQQRQEMGLELLPVLQTDDLVLCLAHACKNISH